MKLALFEGNNEMIFLPLNAKNIPIDVDEWFGERSGRKYADYGVSIVTVPFSIVSDMRIEHGDLPSSDYTNLQKWVDKKIDMEAMYEDE